MLFTWSRIAPLHYVFTLQVHRRRTVCPEQKSPPASTLVIIRPRAFFKSVLFLFRFVELLPCLTSAWSFSLDSWPIAFQKRPYMRSIRRRVNPELKGDGKGKLKDVSGSFFAYVFFFFFFFFRMESLPYSSTYADCVRVMFVLCVCMRTSAVFLFNYLKIWSGWTLKQDKNKPFHDLRLQFQFGTSYLTSKGGANGDLLNRLAKKKKPQRLCTSNSSLEKLLMSQTSRGLLL